MTQVNAERKILRPGGAKRKVFTGFSFSAATRRFTRTLTKGSRAMVKGTVRT